MSAASRRPGPADDALSRRHLLGLVAALSAGCASQRTHPWAGWSGRLSLQVRSEPPQSFSAVFELQGNAQQGQLQLSTPLGHAVAQASWAQGEAVLRSGSQTQRYASAEDLLMAATGAALPLGALFDWLDGRPTAVPGWVPDLSGLSQGRLQARRSEPAPAVDLRIVLER